MIGEAEFTFVERVARFFETDGLPLITGRVIGWLLISDPPEQSGPELAAALGASAGSISTATRMLAGFHIVERVTVRGSRRDHFRIRPGSWEALLAARFARAASFRRITEEGLELLRDAPPRHRERLDDVHELYGWVERELPALWERRRAAAQSTSSDRAADAGREEEEQLGSSHRHLS